MILFAIKRVLWFIPTAVVLSLLLFFLRISVPEQKVSDLLIDSFLTNPEMDPSVSALKEFLSQARNEKLDLPVFYFSFRPKILDDAFDQLLLPERKNWYFKLSLRGYDWNLLQKLESDLAVLSLRENHSVHNKKLLRSTRFNTDLNFVISTLSKITGHDTERAEILTILHNLDAHRTQKVQFIPHFQWHGAKNQFHYWLKGFFGLESKYSIIDHQPIGSKLWKAFTWTSYLGVLVLFFSSLFSILLCLYSFLRPLSIFSRILNQWVLLIYSMPLFWLATLVIVFWTYMRSTSIFASLPNIAVFASCSDIKTISCVFINSEKLILPIFIWVLYLIPYLSEQLLSTLKKERQKLYFIKALSLGKSKKKTLIHDALPNALIPFVTVIIGRIPAIFGGSLIIELLFNVPGLGRLLYDSVFAQDWDLVFYTCLFISFMTMLSMLLGDFLYMHLNPKIRIQHD